MARLRKAWHSTARAHRVEEVGQALAVSAWKVARESVQNLLAADFDFEGETHRFAILEEWLAFLIHVTDHLAERHMDDLKRARLIKTMALRLAETVEDNVEDRVGSAQARERFIDRVNATGRDYAECVMQGEMPGMNFLRCLGAGVCHAAPEIDRRWLMEQVVEVEAPQAVKPYIRSALSLMSAELS